MIVAPTGSGTGDGASSSVAGLSLFADLRVETDGQRLHLVGDGRSLVLHSSHPRQLAAVLRQVPLPAGLRPGNGRRGVGRLANSLRDNGIHVTVRGPEGVVVNLGEGAGSRLGRLLTGSPAVTFGSPRDLAVVAGIPVRAVSLAAATGVIVTVVVLIGRTVRAFSARGR